jgi:predicted phage tail component-like protein
MIGFTYNETHSNVYGIYSKTENRPLLPTMTPKYISVPGRNGIYDFGDNTYEPRIIELTLKYKGTSYDNLRSKAREIAYWLNGQTEKKLVFDDETDKYYMCKIYSDVGLSNLFRVGECTVQFLCNPPFAISTTLRTTTATVTASGDVITVSSSGTAATPSVFFVYNDGLSAISTFSITRETLV